MVTPYQHTIGGRSEPRDPDEGSARKALPQDPAELVLMVPCGQCWQVPDKPCTEWGRLAMGKVRGNHLARYRRANRRGLLGQEALDAILQGLENPDDNSVMIRDDFVERPEQ